MKTQHDWFGVQESVEFIQLRIIDCLGLKGTLTGVPEWSLWLWVSSRAAQLLLELWQAWCHDQEQRKSLGSLSQWPTTLPVKNLSPVSSLNLPWFSFIPFPCFLPLLTRERSAPPLPCCPWGRCRERLVSSLCQVILDSPWICHPWDLFGLLVEVIASRRKLLFPQDWRKRRCLVWDRYLNSR